MDLVQQVAQEVTRILLLVLRVVVEQERLKDALGIDHSTCEDTRSVELPTFVKVFAHVDHLAQKTVLVGLQLDLLIRRNRLKEVEEGGARQQGLQTHVHEAVDLLYVGEAFVWLREVGHGEFYLLGKLQVHIVAHSHLLRHFNRCFLIPDFSAFDIIFLVVLKEFGAEVDSVPALTACLRVKCFHNYLFLFFLLGRSS